MRSPTVEYEIENSIFFTMPVNSKGPTLVNTAVFDPLLLRKFPINAVTSRSQPETRVGYSSLADCRFAQHVQDIYILQCDEKEFGEGIQSKNFVVGFPDIRRIWEMRRIECEIGLRKALT